MARRLCLARALCTAGRVAGSLRPQPYRRHSAPTWLADVWGCCGHDTRLCPSLDSRCPLLVPPPTPAQRLIDRLDADLAYALRTDGKMEPEEVENYEEVGIAAAQCATRQCSECRAALPSAAAHDTTAAGGVRVGGQPRALARA